MNLPSIKPLNKVFAIPIGGVLSLLFFYLLKRFFDVSLDAEGIGLVTSLISLGVASFAAWVTPLSPAEVTQIVQSPTAPVQLPEAARNVESVEPAQP